jgi:hypothetical protein
MFIADATSQGGNPARDASRFAEGFPLMISSQSRAPLRIIKSSKLKRQPKIKSAKAAKNNYSHFAAAVVLAVAGALLASSLSHLAAGIALVTGAGALSGKSSGSSVTGFRATQI